RRVGPARDDEQGVHAAVRGSIGITNEARLAHWTVRGNERRQRVLGAIRGRDRDLRIGRRAASSDRRMEVATGAAVEIEARSQTVRDRIDLLENVGGGVEEIHLVWAEAGKRSAGAGSAGSDARIGRPLRG